MLHEAVDLFWAEPREAGHISWSHGDDPGYLFIGEIEVRVGAPVYLVADPAASVDSVTGRTGSVV